MNEVRFQQGFNHGYILEKYKPELFALMEKDFKAEGNDYFSGLLEGRKQCQKEIQRDGIKKSIEQGGKSQEKSNEKGKKR